MKFSLLNQWPRRTNEALVLTYFTKEKFFHRPTIISKLTTGEKKIVAQLFRTRNFSGKQNEIKILPRANGGKLFLLGLGDKDKWSLRRAVLASRRLVAAAKAEKVSQLNLNLDDWLISGVTVERVAQTVAENMVMANYEFNQYRHQPENAFKVKGIKLLANTKHRPLVKTGLFRGLVVGEGVNLARDLGNIPGGEMTPKLLAEKAQEVGKLNGFKVTILDEAAMKKLNMGAILGVAKGSAEKPRFIIMEYWGSKKDQKPLVFVGKGVTFDTGGLNLKPEKGMNDMHLDMSGGAAVIATLSVIAKLKLPLNVIGLVPAVENMPGSAGYRPGDLLKSMSGKTIEVLNTDAEGRIILADALHYASRYQPSAVIDVATLTGACMVALGTQASGLMTPDEKLQQELIQVGEWSGDYVWPLPMWEEYEEEIKGTFGDVANLGKTPYGGAIHGAVFLKQFIGKYPWAHIDIAGPMKTVEGQFLAKGASGVGVRLLVEFARGRLAKTTSGV